MRSSEFGRAKRLVSGGAKRAAFCKARRSREERRQARIRLRLGAEDVPAVINPRHHTGAEAWYIC